MMVDEEVQTEAEKKIKETRIKKKENINKIIVVNL